MSDETTFRLMGMNKILEWLSADWWNGLGVILAIVGVPSLFTIIRGKAHYPIKFTIVWDGCPEPVEIIETIN